MEPSSLEENGQGKQTKGYPVGEGSQGEGGKGGGGPGFAHHEGPVPPAGGASSPVLTAGDPLQPQHVLGPDRLLPLQWPQPGPRACLQFRLGPGLRFRLRVQLGLHALAQGPWSGLRPRSGPAATLLHLHGLTGPRLACCRRGCQLRLERRRGSVRSPTPGRGLRYRPAPPLAPPTASPPLLKGREQADLGYSRKAGWELALGFIHFFQGVLATSPILWLFCFPLSLK